MSLKKVSYNNLLQVLLVFLLAGLSIWPLRVEIDPASAFLKPGKGALLGTSPLGESIAILLLNGAGATLFVAIAGRLVALLLAAGGIWAGSLSKGVSWLLEKLSEAAIALPSLLIALSFSVLFGNNFVTMLLAIGLSEWSFNQRWLLARLKEYQNPQYVQAAQVMGANRRQIFISHILPELKQDLPFLFRVYLPGSILTVATLEFLGISEGGLGFMVASYRDYVFVYPHVILPPAFTLIALVLLNIRIKPAEQALAVSGK